MLVSTIDSRKKSIHVWAVKWDSPVSKILSLLINQCMVIFYSKCKYNPKYNFWNLYNILVILRRNVTWSKKKGKLICNSSIDNIYLETLTVKLSL